MSGSTGTYDLTGLDPAEFWTRVDMSDSEGCWLIAADSETGYAGFVHNGARYPAHRIAYQLAYGQLGVHPLCIDHLCEVKNCVRPDHLEEVTVAENSRRARRLTARWRKLRAAEEQREQEAAEEAERLRQLLEAVRPAKPRFPSEELITREAVLSPVASGQLPLVMSVETAGRLLGLNETQTRRLIKAGEFPVRVLRIERSRWMRVSLFNLRDYLISIERRGEAA